MTSSVSASSDHTKANKNKHGIDGCSVDNSRINDRIINLSSFAKNISSRTGFLTPKASLAFIQLKKVFIKALILQHFNTKCYIQIKTNASSYAIGEVINQQTTKKGLAGQMTHKTNNQSINPLLKIG